MSIVVPTAEDDPIFIAQANQLLAGVIGAGRPLEVYLIRIDGWFDAKWLKFSGKRLGAVGVWQHPVTVPPFHPSRVLKQECFSMQNGAGELVAQPANNLHIRQPSLENLKRSILNVSSSAVFCWFSSATSSADHGSIMIYRTLEPEVDSWYVSFQRLAGWKLDKHRGITPVELEHLLCKGSAGLVVGN